MYRNRPDYSQLPTEDQPSTSQRIYDEYRARRPLSAPFRKAGDTIRAGGMGAEATSMYISADTNTLDSLHGTHLPIGRPLAMPGLRGGGLGHHSIPHIQTSTAFPETTQVQRPSTALARIAETNDSKVSIINPEGENDSATSQPDRQGPLPVNELVPDDATLRKHHSYLCDAIVSMWNELGIRSAAERYRGWSAPSPSVVLAVCTPQSIKELHNAVLRLLDQIPTNTPPKAIDVNHHSFLYGPLEAPPSTRVATIRRMILMMTKKVVAYTDSAKAQKDKEESYQSAILASARNRPQSAARGRPSTDYDISTNDSRISNTSNGYYSNSTLANATPIRNQQQVVVASPQQRTSQQLATVTPTQEFQQVATISPNRAPRPQSASRSTYSAMSMTTLHTDEHIRRVAAPGPTDLSIFQHNASYYVYTDTTPLTTGYAGRTKSPQHPHGNASLVAINGSTYATSAGISPMAFRHRIAISSSDMADKGTMITPRDPQPVSDAPVSASRERSPDTSAITAPEHTVDHNVSKDAALPRRPMTAAELEIADYPRKEGMLLDEEAEGRAVIVAIQDSLRERVRKLMDRDGERIRVYEYVEYGLPIEDARKKQLAQSKPIETPQHQQQHQEQQAVISKNTNPPSRRQSDLSTARPSEGIEASRYSISPIRARHQQKEAAEAASNALMSAEIDARMLITEEERRARLIESSYVQLSWEEGEERHYLATVQEPQYREDIRFKMHYAGMDLFPEERALTTAAYLEQYQIECEESTVRKELQGAIKRFIQEELQGERAAGAASAIQLKFREHLMLSGRGNISSKTNSPYRTNADHQPSVDLVYVYASEEEANKYKHGRRAPSLQEEPIVKDNRRHSDSFINEVERQMLTGDNNTTPNAGGSRVGDPTLVMDRSTNSAAPPSVGEATPRPSHHEDPLPTLPRQYTDEDRHAAAIKIQCQARCYLARKEFHRRELERSSLAHTQRRQEAATRIQCQVRSHIARKELSRRRLERKPSELTISSSVAGTPYRPQHSSATRGSDMGLKTTPRSERSTIAASTATPKRQDVTQSANSPPSRASSTMSRQSVISTSSAGMRGLSADVVAHAVKAAEEIRFVGNAPSVDASFLEPPSNASVKKAQDSPSMSSKRSSIMAAAAAANGLSTSTGVGSGSELHKHQDQQPQVPRPSSSASARPQSSSSEGRSTIIRNTRIAAIWEFLETLERIKGDEADTRGVLEEDEVFGRYLCVCHWPRPFPIPLIEHAQPQDYSLLCKEEAHHFATIVERERTALNQIIQRAAEHEVRHGSSPGHDTATVRASRPSSARLMDALRRSSSGGSNSRVGGETPTQQATDPLAPRGLPTSSPSTGY